MPCIILPKMKEAFSVSVVSLAVWAHYPFTWHSKFYITFDDDTTNYVENPYWRSLTAENVSWALRSLVVSCWEPVAWLVKMAFCDAAATLAVGGAVICGDLDAPRYILCRESLMEWSPVPWNNVPTPQNGGSRPAQPAAAAVGLGRIVIVRSHSFAL